MARAYFPYYSIYCASKLYNEAMSEALAYEIAPAVDSAIVLPGPVQTNLARNVGVNGDPG